MFKKSQIAIPGLKHDAVAAYGAGGKILLARMRKEGTIVRQVHGQGQRNRNGKAIVFITDTLF